MNKRTLSILLIMSILLMTLSACSAQSVSDGLSVMMGKKEVVQEIPMYAQEDLPDPVQTLVYDESFDHGGYYYQHLSDLDKTIYQALYNCFIDHASDTELYDVNDKQIIQAYKSVIFDHPEIFYVDGYQLEVYSASDVEIKTVFRPNYTKPAEDLEAIKIAIDNYENNIMQNADTSTPFTTVRSIYDYIITHTHYNLTASELSNLCSVVINGEAVCDGYAKATMYYCRQAGVECIVVPGYIRTTGTAHLWNAVKIDDLWYYIDTTWGDEDFENNQRTPEVRYDYLCVSQDQLNGTHQFEDFIAPPLCVANEANYYYQTGHVVTECSDQQLGSMFAGIETSTTIAFACADKKVYQQVEDYLVSQKQVFNYLPSKKVNVGYVTNPNVMSFTFWLRE